MTKTIKKSDLIALYKTFNEIKENTSESSIRFKYGISKNTVTISSEVEILKEIEDAIEAITLPYRQEEFAIYQEYGEADPTGTRYNLKTDDPAKLNEATTKLNKLREDNKELFETRNKKYTEYAESLKDEVTFDFWPMNIDEFPSWIKSEHLDVFVRLGIVE